MKLRDIQGYDPHRRGTLLLLLSGLALPFAGSRAAIAAGGVLTAPEAYKQTQNGAITLFDVRSAPEWRETGIPSGSKTVTIHNPKGLEGFMNEVLKSVDGDKNRPIAMICATGVRSSRARRYLAAHGFTNVYDVSEGVFGQFMSPGWIKRGLPMESCNVC